MAQHTPLPWHACKCGKCTQVGSDDLHLLKCEYYCEDAPVPSKEEAHANAYFIELAVNNHYNLLDACKKSLELFDAGHENSEDDYGFLRKVIAEAERLPPSPTKEGFFPITKGLLVSMAMRADHSYGLDKPEGDSPFSCGHTNESRIELIINMYNLYRRFVCGYQPTEAWWDGQVKEEILGTGFYQPEKENIYAGSWPKDFDPAWLSS